MGTVHHGSPAIYERDQGWVLVSQKVSLYGRVSLQNLSSGGPYIIDEVDSHGLEDHNLWGTITA